MAAAAGMAAAVGITAAADKPSDKIQTEYRRRALQEERAPLFVDLYSQGAGSSRVEFHAIFEKNDCIFVKMGV